MLRHLMGSDCRISADELSFIQVNETSRSESDEQTITLLSVEARVCGDPARLCLRILTWTVLQIKILELAFERSKHVRICPHASAEMASIHQMAKTCFGGSKNPETSQQSEWRRCSKCSFIFQLEISDLVGDSLSIVVTKWLDLGSGVTPMDPKWMRLASRFHDGEGRDEEKREAEQCRADFENAEQPMQTTVTLRMASYLNEQRYKTTMSCLSHGVWTLQHGQRVYPWYWPDRTLLLLGLLGSCQWILISMYIWP